MVPEGPYANRVLWVDLSTGRARVIPSQPYTERFLGGRGLATALYWDRVPPEAPFDHEDNCVVLAVEI